MAVMQQRNKDPNKSTPKPIRVDSETILRIEEIALDVRKELLANKEADRRFPMGNILSELIKFALDKLDEADLRSMIKNIATRNGPQGRLKVFDQPPSVYDEPKLLDELPE